MGTTGCTEDLKGWSAAREEYDATTLHLKASGYSLNHTPRGTPHLSEVSLSNQVDSVSYALKGYTLFHCYFTVKKLLKMFEDVYI